MISRERMLAIIMAYDLNAVAQDIKDGDLSYLVSIPSGGAGWKQYADLTDEEVAAEFAEGKYAGEHKQGLIRGGPLAGHLFVKDLLARYDAEDEGSDDPNEAGRNP